MRMNDIEFYKSEIIGKDELGNDIKDFSVFYIDEGRMTNWSFEEVATENREYLQTHEKILTKAPLAVCQEADFLVYKGGKYEIQELNNMNRWILLVVKAD